MGPLLWDTYFQSLVPHYQSLRLWNDRSTQTNRDGGAGFPRGEPPTFILGIDYHYIFVQVPSELPWNCHLELGKTETVFA